jgi:hypothetical protein
MFSLFDWLPLAVCNTVFAIEINTCGSCTLSLSAVAVIKPVKPQQKTASKIKSKTPATGKYIFLNICNLSLKLDIYLTPKQNKGFKHPI